MVLWVLVRLLLVVREGVDAHIAVITTPLRISHGSGGEVGGRHHDWGLHALLPHLAAAALLWKRRAKVSKTNLQQMCTCFFWLYLIDGPTFHQSPNLLPSPFLNYVFSVSKHKLELPPQGCMPPPTSQIAVYMRGCPYRNVDLCCTYIECTPVLPGRGIPSLLLLQRFLPFCPLMGVVHHPSQGSKHRRCIWQFKL